MPEVPAPDEMPVGNVVETQLNPMAEASVPNPPQPTHLQRASTGLGLLVLLASALFGGNVLGMRERFFGSESPEERPAAVSRAAEGTTPTGGMSQPTEEPNQTVLRSQPWWQGVGKLEGVGSMTGPAFHIDGGAVQWRVKWTCQAGQLVVRAPDQRRPVVDTACPGTGTGYGVQKGAVSLQVTATGPWRVDVDQQVDVPLNEPPLASMIAPGAVVVATGSLYRIDQVGTGTVNIYRLADGSHALRLDNFFVTANTDLELQLSALEEPRSTRQFTDAPRSATIAKLDVTTGSLNLALPASLDPSQYRSLVIWCEVANSAYAATTLTTP